MVGFSLHSLLRKIGTNIPARVDSFSVVNRTEGGGGDSRQNENHRTKQLKPTNSLIRFLTYVLYCRSIQVSIKSYYWLPACRRLGSSRLATTPVRERSSTRFSIITASKAPRQTSETRGSRERQSNTGGEIAPRTEIVCNEHVEFWWLRFACTVSKYWVCGI